MPLSTPEEDEAAHELITVLLNTIADALRENRLHELVSALGAKKFELKAAGGGVLVCNLRRLNKVLELKLNVIGLGVNLNAVIERLLPPQAREI